MLRTLAAGQGCWIGTKVPAISPPQVIRWDRAASGSVVVRLGGQRSPHVRGDLLIRNKIALVQDCRKVAGSTSSSRTTGSAGRFVAAECAAIDNGHRAAVLLSLSQ